MKYKLALLSISTLLSCHSDIQTIRVTNQNDFQVRDKLIIVRKVELNNKEGKKPIVLRSNGKEITSQLLDVDEDASWDQLLFQVTLEARESLDFSVQWLPIDDYPAYDKQVQVRLGYSQSRDGNFKAIDYSKRGKEHTAQKAPYTYQFEGPGWESNRVAFRSYFDTRNGKDIFGKTTEDIVTEQIGTGENYHSLQDWGMDILKVGQSLGAGGLAIQKEDSLIRLGETLSAEFFKVEDGPIYASFRLIYKGWDVLGHPYELEENISIQANKRWYQSDISLKTDINHRNDTLIVGIVNLEEVQVDSINYAGIKSLFTHGRQSENKDILGLGVLVSEANFIAFSQAPKEGIGITNSELIALKPFNNTYTFRFYAGWELENSDFSSRDKFRDHLKTAMQNLSARLEVRID
ncbi:MAG: DUF4861 family protein [Bacteroidota bacterium]